MNDPRGPVQKIVSVERPESGGVLVSLSCLHVRSLNPIFSYRVGDDCRCFACAQKDNTP